MALINDLGGGMLDGKEAQGGPARRLVEPVLTAAQCQECTLDAESIRSLGSMAGSGAIIVISEEQCIVEYTSRLGDFYYRESCGKCTPCREGTFWLSRVLRRIEAGGGREQDVELMIDVCNNIDGKSLCALGEAAAWPIRSSVQQFTDDYLAHVTARGCPHRDGAASPAPGARSPSRTRRRAPPPSPWVVEVAEPGSARREPGRMKDPVGEKRTVVAPEEQRKRARRQIARHRTGGEG